MVIVPLRIRDLGSILVTPQAAFSGETPLNCGDQALSRYLLCANQFGRRVGWKSANASAGRY
jgi:hypothetical protein